jgi:hypothetical protein
VHIKGYNVHDNSRFIAYSFSCLKILRPNCTSFYSLDLKIGQRTGGSAEIIFKGVYLWRTASPWTSCAVRSRSYWRTCYLSTRTVMIDQRLTEQRRGCLRSTHSPAGRSTTSEELLPLWNTIVHRLFCWCWECIHSDKTDLSTEWHAQWQQLYWYIWKPWLNCRGICRI